jgi:outer membrane protein assembly factor BamB
MKPLLNLVALAALVGAVRADDWPQFRGPNRDGVSKETGLLKAWPAGGPKLLWTYKDAGNGYSCPAIVGDVLYTMGARGNEDYVFALDIKASPPAQKWATKIGPTFTWPKGPGLPSNHWNRGPSATPTVADGNVYALAGGGEMVCVAAADGKKKWRTNLLTNLNGDVYNYQDSAPKGAGWGFTGSPVIDGDNVIVMPGGPKGTLAALNARTGAVVWRSEGLTETATYSSPVLADIGGKRQCIVMLQNGVAGVAAKDGSLLWRYERSREYGDIVAPTPVVKDNYVYITAAPQGGRDLIQVTADGGKFTAKKVYADKKLENTHGGVVLVGDNLYGCSKEKRATWFCQDFKTGKIHWEVEDREVGKGAVVYADGRLYLLGDKTAEVGLAEASPAEWKLFSHFTLPEQSKMRMPQGAIWTHPVIADGKLYLRDQELIFCYEVK